MLTDAKIKAAEPKERSYKLADAGQLYLIVTTAGGRLWRMNYAYGRNAVGKPAQKTLPLGACPLMTLSEVRTARDDAKKILREGRDPAIVKRVEMRAARAESDNGFEPLARRWHTLRKPTLSKVHAADVLLSLERDIFPSIGSWPLSEITAPVLLDVLNAVEKRGAIETAHRLRQRISDIFV